MSFDKLPGPWYLALSVLITVIGAVVIWLDPNVMVPFQMWVLTLVWALNAVGWCALYTLARVRSCRHQASPPSEEEPAE